MGNKADHTRPLAGRVALVTGAGRGIGLAIAHGLAAAGCNVAVGCRTLHRAEALAKELEKTHRVNTLAIELDVTNRPSCENMGEKLLKKYRRIDILVNNAGVMHMDQLFDGDIDDFTESLTTNAGGAYLVTRALVEEMIQSRGGHIINIAAMAGLAGAPFLSAFCASKAALISLTQSWAQELAGDGITVHALCPDMVDTEGLRETVNLTGDAAGAKLLRPEAVADAVLALITGENDAPSGAIIPLEIPAGAAATVNQ